eukprot:CAMPEP_0119316038 /NCGR_PEP_ID=MMETSP1333-20130426/38251_1 /TAXON_ID=418940 /ORGANISM="Scyphosphaera apsteinii, Strain RCC1455" /LENGTH=43 /DNA_ID= /DNA_START= /DNA_END= /DNA_ORIENTATION=
MSSSYRGVWKSKRNPHPVAFQGVVELHRNPKTTHEQHEDTKGA